MLSLRCLNKSFITVYLPVGGINCVGDGKLSLIIFSEDIIASSKPDKHYEEESETLRKLNRLWQIACPKNL